MGPSPPRMLFCFWCPFKNTQGVSSDVATRETKLKTSGSGLSGGEATGFGVTCMGHAKGDPVCPMRRTKSNFWVLLELHSTGYNLGLAFWEGVKDSLLLLRRFYHFGYPVLYMGLQEKPTANHSPKSPCLHLLMPKRAFCAVVCLTGSCTNGLRDFQPLGGLTYCRPPFLPCPAFLFAALLLWRPRVSVPLKDASVSAALPGFPPNPL